MQATFAPSASLAGSSLRHGTPRISRAAVRVQAIMKTTKEAPAKKGEAGQESLYNVDLGAALPGSSPSAADLSPGQQYALTLPGISQPFPNMFDPAGFTRTAKATDIKRWRESELMHGRVAMLAAVGFIVGEQLEDFPAFMNFDGQITGPAIFQFQKVEEVRPLFWESLVLFIGLAESFRVAKGWATPTGNGFNNLKEDYEPGNLGFDPLNLLPTNPLEREAMQTRELNNGRLAMLAIAGFTLQELVPPNREIFEHLFLYFEREAILELEDIDPFLSIPVPEVPPAGVPAALVK